MDLYDSAEHGTDLVDALGRIGTTAVQVIGVETDSLFPLHQQHALADALEQADIPVQFVAVDSIKGHVCVSSRHRTLRTRCESLHRVAKPIKTPIAPLIAHRLLTPK